MNDSSPLVFGQPPAGVVCRNRAATYVVVHNREGDVAVVSARVRGREAFWLPGGGKLEQETPEQTIIREVREELGREVRLHRKIGQAIQFFFAGDENCWYEMTATFFLGEFDGEANGKGDFKLRWVNPTCQNADFFHACHVWAITQSAQTRI